MATSDKAEELRKKLALVQKRISKAANEKIELTKALETIENSCSHQWSKPQLIKGSRDSYEKSCAFCGKTVKSKGVQINW